MPAFRVPGSLAKAGAVVLLPAVALAVVLGLLLMRGFDSGAQAQARAQADVLARSLGERELARAARTDRTAHAARARVNAHLRNLTGTRDVVAARIVGADRKVRFSSDPAERGGRLQAPELQAALTGKTEAAVNRVGDDKVIDTFVPLRTSTGASPSAALQVEMAAKPFESAVAGSRRLMAAVLVLGLLALCALAFRLARRGGPSAAPAASPDGEAARDTLTGLPSRAQFHRLLQQALTSCPTDRHVAVLLMDLDRFKEINDSLGHFNGDLVIERVGRRLDATRHEGEVVARLGGDEFAMLLPDIANDEQVRMVSRRIHAALEEPFTAGGLALRVEASVGAALYRRDGDNPSNLLRSADVAMYAAKEARSGFEFFSEDQRRYTPERLGLVAQLQRAMDSGELVLYYQPKARLDTGTVVGVEALVRWNHPQRGLLYPDEFIPVTEHTSMIRPMTVHLLELALEQSRVWRSQGLDLGMAVNLSAQLLLDLGLPREIGKMLTRRGTATNRLELEITESAIAADPRRAKKILSALRQMGVGVAIDDFGTGYSSLVSLKELPVTTLKVDKSFVMGMKSDPDDIAIVRSTVVLGRDLGLQVVSEGVEDQRAWDTLREMGADVAQGYHLSRPLPPDDFARWLSAYDGICPGGVRRLHTGGLVTPGGAAGTPAPRSQSAV